MNTAVKIQEVRIKHIDVTKDTTKAHLMNGRTISVEGMLYGIPAPRPRTPSKLSLKSEKKKTEQNRHYRCAPGAFRRD